jgi:hypothetical protein
LRREPASLRCPSPHTGRLVFRRRPRGKAFPASCHPSQDPRDARERAGVGQGQANRRGCYRQIHDVRSRRRWARRACPAALPPQLSISRRHARYRS